LDGTLPLSLVVRKEVVSGRLRCGAKPVTETKPPPQGGDAVLWEHSEASHRSGRSGPGM